MLSARSSAATPMADLMFLSDQRRRCRHAILAGMPLRLHENNHVVKTRAEYKPTRPAALAGSRMNQAYRLRNELINA